MRVYNPLWLQVIFYAAIAGFPCLAGYMFYLAFDLYPKSGVIAAGGCLLLGFGVGYISYIGILLAKFVPAVVEFDDEHFTVSMKGLKTSYKWSDIASVKNYEGSQILKLYDKSGKTIYVVDHMTPGYQNFAQKVDEVVGI